MISVSREKAANKKPSFCRTLSTSSKDRPRGRQPVILVLRPQLQAANHVLSLGPAEVPHPAGAHVDALVGVAAPAGRVRVGAVLLHWGPVAGPPRLRLVAREDGGGRTAASTGRRSPPGRGAVPQPSVSP